MTPLDRSLERLEMVDLQIAARGVRSPQVLHAMRRIPREAFFPGKSSADAYADKAVAVGEGQTISQPFIVAFMTEALDLAPSHRVLEIGTGTGYQTAILAMLAGSVFSVERIEALSVSAQQRLADLQVTNVAFLIADGSVGWPEAAPFDRIIVTAGAPAVPQHLANQLGEGGRMVIPVGEESSQQLVLVERREGRFIETPLLRVRFVRLIGAAAYAE